MTITIWRWATSFRQLPGPLRSLPKTAHLLLCSALVCGLLRAAPVTGSVVLRDSRVAAVSKLGDYSGVVISLSPPDGAAVLTPKRARMLQKDKTFIPHVLAISIGSTVDFPNADPIFHNAFSSYSGQIFDVGLYPPGKNRAIRFTRPGVVRVFCNIHPSMSAVIVALDTPWFDVTRRDGSFSIETPPGDYELSVYHERATETTLHQLTRRIVVTHAPLEIPPIIISESGYLAMPHTNKYGRPYPPGSDEDSLYPGAHQ
jgi:plastocyanin